MNYLKITKCDIANGEGVRIVLWTTGCSHKCPCCHNPQTWNCNNGIPFTQETLDEILCSIDKPYINGITFSGGDPLNIANVLIIANISAIIKSIFPNKSQWLYTGYTWEEILNRPLTLDAIECIDVLIDGRFENDKRDISLPFCGSSNQRIIDVQKSLAQNEIVLYDI